MRKGIKLTSLLSVAMFGAATAWAELPVYGVYQLQARANFGSGFNLPGGSFFTSSTPLINKNSLVAVKMMNITGTDSQGFWVGRYGAGQIDYQGAAEASLGNGDLNDLGRIAFEVNFGTQNGIFQYDYPTDTGSFVTNGPLGSSSWSAAQVNNDGVLAYRASFLGPNVWVSYDPNVGTAVIHAADNGAVPSSPYSFLFTPSFNNNRQIAGKVRRGPPGATGNSQPDEIRIFATDGSSVIIARDRDGDPNSLFRGFDNSVSLTNNGWVAFTADVWPSGRGVFFSNGVETLTLATTTGGIVNDIDFFPPVASDSGLVAFRARETATNLRAIYVSDGTTLQRVVREHDLLPTDLGTARIDQNDSSPVFGGAPAINFWGDIAFNAALTPPDNNQIEWGSGIFVAIARNPGDLNCDGAVDFSDIDAFVAALGGLAAYEQAYPDCKRWFNADIDGDGTVSFADIDPFVALLGG